MSTSNHLSAYIFLSALHVTSSSSQRVCSVDILCSYQWGFYFFSLYHCILHPAGTLLYYMQPLMFECLHCWLHCLDYYHILFGQIYLLLPNWSNSPASYTTCVTEGISPENLIFCANWFCIFPIIDWYNTAIKQPFHKYFAFFR